MLCEHSSHTDFKQNIGYHKIKVTKSESISSLPALTKSRLTYAYS